MTPAPALPSDLSVVLKSIDPDNAASLILAAIKVISGESRICTGRALAYVLSHDDFLAPSRVVFPLSANCTAFGYRVPNTSPDITKTVINGLKMATPSDIPWVGPCIRYFAAGSSSLSQIRSKQSSPNL
jgi:hypothetical protein